MIRSTNCIDEYVRMNSKTVSWYYANPELKFPQGGDGLYQKIEEELECGSSQLTDHSQEAWKPINKEMEQYKEDIQSEIDGTKATR